MSPKIHIHELALDLQGGSVYETHEQYFFEIQDAPVLGRTGELNYNSTGETTGLFLKSKPEARYVLRRWQYSGVDVDGTKKCSTV